MYRALKCKFSIYPHLNSMLLSTAGSVLVEASPHDLFWGGGRDGEGLNYLGRLLMKLRSEFLGESSSSSETPSLTVQCLKGRSNNILMQNYQNCLMCNLSRAKPCHHLISLLIKPSVLLKRDFHSSLQPCSKFLLCGVSHFDY